MTSVEENPATTTALAGTFDAIGLSDLVGLLQASRRDGRVSVLTPRAAGQLLFVEGQVFHVAFGGATGEEAFYAMLMEPEGRFHFVPEVLDRRSIPNTVAVSPTALLVEGARRIDEAALREVPPPERVRVAPAPHPDDDLVRVLERVLSKKAPAPVSVSDVQGLARLTGSGEGPPPVIFGLVADRVQAARWMLEAAPADPATLLGAALGGGTGTLRVAWSLPGGRSLEVVLFDADVPARCLEGIRRRVAGLIVAPPGERWRGITIRARVELSMVLARLAPAVLLGVGGAGLAEKLDEMATQAETSCMSLLATGRHTKGAPLVGWLREAVAAWRSAVHRVP